MRLLLLQTIFFNEVTESKQEDGKNEVSQPNYQMVVLQDSFVFAFQVSHAEAQISVDSCMAGCHMNPSLHIFALELEASERREGSEQHSSEASEVGCFSHLPLIWIDFD